MSRSPMMACGHAANAYRTDNGAPSCAICIGIHPGAETVAATPPDLTGRTARCGYYGRPARSRSREGPCNGTWATRDNPCLCERPSSDGANPDGPARLAFFEHQPTQPHDRYYCGCWGWD